MNSLVTGLARQGAEISPATLAGTCAQAGALLVPLADAITERSRGSWHLHADETTWRVFAPREGDGPAKWWLWVFIGPDTVCFVMDPDAGRGGAGPSRRHRRGDRAAHRRRGRRAAQPGDLQRLLVRREALSVQFRMEVKDRHRLAVAAAGRSRRQPEPGIGGEGGSSLDKVAAARHCRTGRAR